MNAPVGKSGPFTSPRSVADGTSGSSIIAVIAAATSRRLCGGMLVAIPTAMPAEPFTRRLGSADGRTVGSSRRSSKFGAKSTVFLSMSVSISTATFVRRDSVYRYAAAGSPSTEPKFPCPSTSG